MTIFDDRESNVRSYCRSFPDVFQRAKGSVIYAESGAAFIDFFAGAGALNYGHNNDEIKRKVIDHLAADNLIHGMDMYTAAKREFLEKFSDIALAPKHLDYKVQFCGPTGTNAVEAAFKLARKIKKRAGVFAFAGGYHGVSLGSLAATSGLSHRAAAGLPLANVTFMPYPFGFMETFDTIEYMDAVLADVNSGVEKPAAVIFETVQAEGGIVVAPDEWVRRLRDLCDRHDILLICDDIQVGCGRTGPFFSFERAGVVPDMVTLSKSISGYGGPMSLLLMKRELDIWEPAEHTGTFRGYQPALVGATAALEYFRDHDLAQEVRRKGAFLESYLTGDVASLGEGVKVRGVGMIWGVDVAGAGGPDFARQVSSRCYELGLIIERVGRNDTVLKVMPPLTTELDILAKGCEIIKQSLADCVKNVARPAELSAR